MISFEVVRMGYIIIRYVLGVRMKKLNMFDVI